MTKEQFLDYAQDLLTRNGQLLEAVRRALDSGVVDYESAEVSYKEVYPLVAAVLEKTAYWYVNGSVIEAERRRCRRLTNKYKKIIRL